LFNAKRAKEKAEAVERQAKEKIKAEKDFISGLREYTKKTLGESAPATDALITNKGEFIKFSPKDNIIATQTPPTVTSTGVSATAGRPQQERNIPSTIQVNLYLDSKKLLEEHVKLSRY
jgi:hypothetical protein